MDTQNAQIILDAGAALVDPVRDHGGIPYVAMPEGYSVNDLESLLPQPTRKRAKVVMLDAPSFIAYAKKHGSLPHRGPPEIPPAVRQAGVLVRVDPA